MMSHKLWVTAVGVVTYRQENERQAGREGGGKNTMMNAKRKYKDGEKKIKEMRCLLLKSMLFDFEISFVRGVIHYEWAFVFGTHYCHLLSKVSFSKDFLKYFILLFYVFLG